MVFLCQFLHVYFFSRVDFEVLETGLKSLLKPKIETHDIFPLYVGMLSLNSLIFLLFILKIIRWDHCCSLILFSLGALK